MALVDWEFWRTAIVVICAAMLPVGAVLLIANATWVVIDILRFWIEDRRGKR